MKRSPLARKTPLRSKSTLKRSPMRRSRKPKRIKTLIRSRAHRRFVASQPCCVPGCGRRRDIHAHHHRKLRNGGGTGLKPCDAACVPFCEEHHGEMHQRSCIGEWSAEETDVFLTQVAADLAERSIAAGILPAGGSQAC